VTFVTGDVRFRITIRKEYSLCTSLAFKGSVVDIIKTYLGANLENLDF